MLRRLLRAADSFNRASYLIWFCYFTKENNKILKNVPETGSFIRDLNLIKEDFMIRFVDLRHLLVKRKESYSMILTSKTIGFLDVAATNLAQK